MWSRRAGAVCATVLAINKEMRKVSTRRAGSVKVEQVWTEQESSTDQYQWSVVTDEQTQPQGELMWGRAAQAQSGVRISRKGRDTAANQDSGHHITTNSNYVPVPRYLLGHRCHRLIVIVAIFTSSYVHYLGRYLTLFNYRFSVYWSCSSSSG